MILDNTLVFSEFGVDTWLLQTNLDRFMLDPIRMLEHGALPTKQKRQRAKAH